MNFNLGLTFSGMVYILLIIIIYFKKSMFYTHFRYIEVFYPY